MVGIDKDKYTAHISNQDKIFDMRRIIDKIELVLNKHTCEFTDFLDPYERELAKSILNRFDDINYSENGGIQDSERQIIAIFPDYYCNDNVQKNISVLRISDNLDSLSHKDFLGAILNLGIKRSKIGDILVHEDYTDIIVKNEVVDFLLINLEKIGNRKIIVNNVDIDSIKPVPLKYKEINKSLSSYRLDVFISATYNLSRQKSLDIINSQHVKVNWEPINKPNKELIVGDIVSVRGYGRFILHAVEGISKKNKIKANIRILI